MDSFETTPTDIVGKTVKDYLASAAKTLGLARNAKKTVPETMPNAEKVINQKAIERAIATLKEYKNGKRNLESRIVEEEEWWKLRHWDIIRGNRTLSAAEKRPEPTSAWLFNSITNKHADIMDNYPEANVLPREKTDEADAQILSSVLPVVFERNRYEQTYSDAAWYKLKHGVSAKGVFWNSDLENGLGDIDTRFIDILNIYWEPGIRDLQSSRNLFIVSLRDQDLLEAEYPQLKHKTGGQIIDVKQYVYDDQLDVSKKSLIVDWYYKKKTTEGKTVLHFCKFVGNEVLFSSEDDPRYADGFYHHGKYPVEFDVLFPEEGTPVGFGYIAVMKSPQLYIDKLSQVILENSMMSAKVRYFIKKGAGINKEQFLDWSNPLVEYGGEVGNIQPIHVQQVGANILSVLQMKIDELKETSSNRDFSQGSTSGGVTAAAAIAALQEAGNKTSRDMIAASYRSYTNECYLAIELIRQFYDEQRTFRITGKTGQNEYVSFSNERMAPQPIPTAYDGQEAEPDYVEAKRVPIFDVVIRPQKRSPYSKMAQNELGKELLQRGFFHPQLADQSLAALELMDFDGIEKVREHIEQGQTLTAQVQALQQQLQQLGGMVYQLTGQDLAGLYSADTPDDFSTIQKPGGGQWEKSREDTRSNPMTPYGKRLAERAKPDMEAQT